jgi:hypothetical protein
VVLRWGNDERANLQSWRSQVSGEVFHMLRTSSLHGSSFRELQWVRFFGQATKLSRKLSKPSQSGVPSGSAEMWYYCTSLASIRHVGMPCMGSSFLDFEPGRAAGVVCQQRQVILHTTIWSNLSTTFVTCPVGKGQHFGSIQMHSDASVAWRDRMLEIMHHISA